MDKGKKLALLADIFELSSELKEDTALDDLENWDSMSAIALIALIDDEFGKKLTAEKIKSFKTVRDILDYMEE